MRNPFLTRINRLPNSLRLSITPTAIVLRQSSGWWNARMRIVAECALSKEARHSPQLLTGELARVLKDAACANKPITVVLADELVRMFMVTPPLNTTSLEDCQAAMSMRARHLYGEDISNWELQADLQANQAFLVCAMPAWLLSAIKKLTNEHRLTLLSIMPHFVTAWNRWYTDLHDDGWFGICHGNTLTLAALHQKKLGVVRTLPIQAAVWQDPQWLSAQLTREALRINMPIPHRIQLCGAVPDHVFSSMNSSLECLRLDTRQNAAGEIAISSTGSLTYTGGGA
jgi:hypothetical protein